jgi:transglutaminase-like putative cysteine protease
MGVSEPGAMRRILLAAAYAGMLALGAGAAGRIYHGPLFALLVAGAAVGSVGLGLALVNTPQWTVAPLSVLGMAGYAGFCVWYSAKASGVTGGYLEVLVDALRNGGPRLLTALIPVEAQPDTVLLPVVLVWLAGLISGELGVRASHTPLALLPPVLVYGGALIFAGPHGGVEAWRALAFVALAAAALAAATPRAAGPRGVGPTLPARKQAPLRAQLRIRAAGGLAVFVGLAALVVPVVAAGLPHQPADPRVAVSPPQSDTLDQDPLARISGWMQNPTQPLFDATVSKPGRIALAVLSDFDGVTWTIGADYRDAGRQLPAPSAPPGAAVPAGGTRVTQQITVRELTGRLVPAITTPREVEGIRVAYDIGSGTLLRPDGLHPGDSYSVVSEVDSTNPNQLPLANVPSGQSVARYLTTGAKVPDDIVKLAASIEEGNGGAYQRAYALEQFLAEHYTFVTDVPSGHAYPNLRFFLLGPAAQGGQRGTSEQFAAAYAVLGRIMGLPTRVVVGFTAKSGQGTIRGADALAWPEVLFTGLGWVAFNPLPNSQTQHRDLAQDYQPPPPPSTPPAKPTTAAPQLPSRSASASHSAAPVASGPVLAPWVPWAAGGTLLGLVLVAQFGVVVARVVRGRRRLRSGTPSDRVRGAWLELLDGLRLAGRPAPRHLTATEVAAWAGQVSAVRPLPAAGPAAQPRGAKRGPLPPLTQLAELVNLVAFAPEWADERDAAAATDETEAYLRRLRRDSRLSRRLVWWLRPGPLRWRHGTAPRPAPTISSSDGTVRPAVPTR